MHTVFFLASRTRPFTHLSVWIVCRAGHESLHSFCATLGLAVGDEGFSVGVDVFAYQPVHGRRVQCCGMLWRAQASWQRHRPRLRVDRVGMTAE